MKPDPNIKELPLKGDTVIGNDVWIGQNATILPGLHIGDGAIIGLIPLLTDSNIKYVKTTLKKIINGLQ